MLVWGMDEVWWYLLVVHVRGSGMVSSATDVLCMGVVRGM